MDRVHSYLTRISGLVNDYDRPVRTACVLGRKLLNKYYSLTDGSAAYRIVMGESPVPEAQATQ